MSGLDSKSWRSPTRGTRVLKEAIVRQFDGGWNVVDNDLTMKPIYSKILRNVVRAQDGTNQQRYGTAYVNTISATSDLVNIFAYANSIVCVLTNGDFNAYYNDTGHVIDTSKWGNTDYCTACEFNGELIVVNGTDKPILVPVTLVPQFLQDLGTGSNVFTPISRYVVTQGQYVIHAGMADKPTVLSISAKGTSGTYLGDPAPNDAVEFDMGPFINRGSAIITGLGSFRDRLIVCFNDNIAIVVLGEYVESAHVPRVEDVIHNHGTISHNAIVDLGDDMIFMDIVGVPSIKRAQFTQTLTPNRVSEYIDPEIQKSVRAVTLETHSKRTFAVHDRVQRQTLFFVPNTDSVATTTETRGFVLSTPVNPRVRTWSEFTNMKWRCGTVTAEGDVFFGREGDLFRYGNTVDPVYSDLQYLVEPYSDGTMHTDGTGFIPVATDPPGVTELSGLPIPFIWEMPWTFLDTRTVIKNCRYIVIDTQGTGAFTAKMFIDNIYYDKSYPDWRDDPQLNPTLELQFVAGDRGGFGDETFIDEFGGSRNTIDERLTAWTTKFKLMKMRFDGTTKGPLKFVAVGILYIQGSIRR